MSSSSRAIDTLSALAVEPEKMARFLSLVQLSQRTSFIKSLLCLSDSDELIRAQIRKICEQQGIACKIPRGAAAVVVSNRNMGPEARYHAGFLLNMLLTSGVRSPVDKKDDKACADLIDRLVYIYRRYLSNFQLKADSAVVSFEYFYLLYTACLSNEFSMAQCDNCGARYLVAFAGHAGRCPVCQTHRHAFFADGAAETSGRAGSDGRSSR